MSVKAKRATRETLPHYNGSLIRIDHYGERLTGCIECNRWSWSWRRRGKLSRKSKDYSAQMTEYSLDTQEG